MLDTSIPMAFQSPNIDLGRLYQLRSALQSQGLQNKLTQLQMDQAAKDQAQQDAINNVFRTSFVPESQQASYAASLPGNNPLTGFRMKGVGMGISDVFPNVTQNTETIPAHFDSDKATNALIGLGPKGIAAAGGLAQLNQLLAKPETEYTTNEKMVSVNPSTGKMEQYAFGKNGELKWLGVPGAFQKPEQLRYPNPKNPDQEDVYELNPVTGERKFMGTQDKFNKKAGTTVNVSTGGEKKFAEKLGELDASRVNELTDKANAAVQMVSTIGDMRRLDAAGTYNGLADSKMAVNGVLQGLGLTPIDSNKYSNSAAFQSQAKQLMLAKIKTLGANPTDNDVRTIESTLPNLNTSPEARKKLYDMFEKYANAQIATSDEGRAYGEKNNGLRGWNEAEAFKRHLSGQNKPTALPSKNASGWVLHTDAKGNKAYVNPSNPTQYQEVK